jgi:hypothetical protein
MVGDHARFRRVTTPILPQQPSQCALIVMGKLTEKEVNIDGMQRRELRNKALAGRGFDGAIHIDGLETRPDGSHGFDTAHGDASAWPRQQANAAFSLAKDAARTRSRSWRYRLDLGEFVLERVCTLLPKGRPFCRGF